MGEPDDLRALRAAVADGRVVWHQHALERILEREITRAEVLRTITIGEVIERYPSDRPFQSYLIMAVETEPLHVLAAADTATRTCHVVTAYRPDLEHFEVDLKTRRKR